jgi:hypothetical protein
MVSSQSPEGEIGFAAILDRGHVIRIERKGRIVGHQRVLVAPELA